MPYKKIKKIKNKKKTTKIIFFNLQIYTGRVWNQFPNTCFSPNIALGEEVNPIPTPLEGKLSW